MIKINKNVTVTEEVFNFCNRKKGNALALLTDLKNEGYLTKINSPFTMIDIQLSLINRYLDCRKYVYVYRLKKYCCIDDFGNATALPNRLLELVI